MHKHHIVFRSQGGLDFSLNFKYLTYEEHEGNNGPHRNRETDLMYKKELQEELLREFKENKSYSLDDIANKLGRSRKYFEKHFRKVPSVAGLYRSDDIIRKLMGGKLY